MFGLLAYFFSQGAIDYTNTGASDYVDRTADARVKQYQTPGEASPTNQLDKNYSDVAEAARLYGTDFNTQKSGLQQKYGYGIRSALLDTFLGKQDGRNQINTWQNQVAGGLKDAQGQYKGIADQQARIGQANQTNQAKFGELQGYLNQSVADRKKAEADAMKAAADKAIADGRGLHGGPQTAAPTQPVGEDDPTQWDRSTYKRR